MAYTTPNAKRDSSRWEKYWPNVTDFNQLVANQVAMQAAIVVDHNSATGKHTAKNASAWINGLVTTAWANLALANVVDSVITADMFNTKQVFLDTASYGVFTPSSPGGTIPNSYAVFNTPLGIGMNAYWGGLPLCKGTTAAGGEAEAVLEIWAATRLDGRFTHCLIRRTGSAGATNFTPLTVGTTALGLRLGFSVGIVGYLDPTDALKSQRDVVLANGFPYCRNHYDRWYQNAEAISSGIATRHTANVSNTITLEEFYGGKFYQLPQTPFNFANQFTTAQIARHNGLQMCVIPGAFATGVDTTKTQPPSAATTSVTAEYAILPAYDDTYMYLCLFRRPGLGAVGTSSIIPAATVISLALPASASFTGSFNGAPTVTLGNPLISNGSTGLPDILDKNDEINAALFYAEHRKADGMHALGLDRLNGYSLIKNAVAVTVPAAIGSVNSLTLEAWPATNPIYFGGLVMAAGGGIIAVSYGGDETNAKVYFRRVTAGTTNAGTFTCVRASRL